MQKLKLTPVANAKKLNRNELKNIFGGFGSDGNGDFGSDGADDHYERGGRKCNLYVAACFFVSGNSSYNAYSTRGGGWNCCR